MRVLSRSPACVLVVPLLLAPLPAAGVAGDGLFPDRAVRIARPETLYATFLSVSAADFDGDGRIDLAGPTYWHGGLLVRQSDSGWDWVNLEIPDSDQERGWSRAADLDGDGLADLVAVTEFGGLFLFWGSRSEGLLSGESPVSPDGRARALALADFDGDGVGDIAVAVDRGDTSSARQVFLEVFLGKRDRSFTVIPPVLLASPTIALTSSDFDADGKPDLAVLRIAAPGASGQYILEALSGNGTGGFGRTWEADIAGQPTGLVDGDVSGDGRPDLLVWMPSESSVRIFLGNGDATFSGAGDHFVYHPKDLAIADLDGDAGEEILAFQDDESLEVLRFGAPGALQSGGQWLAGGRPALPPADMDGDGRLDAVLFDDKGLALLRGAGGGTFVAPRAIPTWSEEAVAAGAFLTFHHGSLAVDDVDGDTMPDLLWVRVGVASSELAIALGNGDGSFGAPESMRMADAGSYTLSPFILADLDGDGRKDIVFGDYGVTFPEAPGSLRLYPGRGDGTFQEGPVYSAGIRPYALAVGPIDGDAFVDVAVDDWEGTLWLFRGNGDGTLSPWTTFPIARGLVLPVLGDLDGLGGIDLAFTSPDQCQLDVLFADGAGGFERRTFLPSATGISFGIPILAVDREGPLPSLIIPAGDSFGRFSLAGRELVRRGTLLARLPTCEAGSLADVDGDGTRELVLAGNEDLEVFVPGEPTPLLVSPAPLGTRPLAIADLDLDGRLDVVTMGPSIAVHLNRGVAAAARFIRGDARPDGKINLTDPIAILEYLFLGKKDPTGACPAAMDSNSDGGVDLSDPVVLLVHLFLGGPPPGAPFPSCGTDPAASLTCVSTAPCR